MKKINKKKFKAYLIEDEIYKNDFWFCVGEEKDFLEFIKKQTGVEETYSGGIGAFRVISFVWFIWSVESDITTMVHEISHFVDECFDKRLIFRKGMSLIDITEPRAYYTQYILEKIAKASL